jgi:hypothetical protein
MLKDADELKLKTQHFLTKLCYAVLPNSCILKDSHFLKADMQVDPILLFPLLSQRAGMTWAFTAVTKFLPQTLTLSPTMA